MAREQVAYSAIEQQRIVEESQSVYVEAKRYAENQLQELGEEQFYQAVKQNLLFGEHKGVGRFKIDLIDNVWYVRVVHEKSGVAVLFLPIDQINKNSKHLRQKIAREHMSGHSRDNKRDVMIPWLHQSEVEDIDYFPRPRLLSLEGINEYVKAIFQKPHLGAVQLACVCAGIEIATTFCFSSLNGLIDSKAGLRLNPVLVSTAFSMIIGTFVDTYNNWTFQGSKFWRSTKRSSVSLLFSYLLTGATAPQGFGAFDPTTKEGILMNVFVWATTFLSNYLRDYWLDIVGIRRDLRLNNGKVKISLPGLDESVETKINREAFESQMIRQVPGAYRSAILLLSTGIMHYFEGVPGANIIIISASQLLNLAQIYVAKPFSIILMKRTYSQVLKEWEQEPNEKNKNRVELVKKRYKDLKNSWKRILWYTTLPITGPYVALKKVLGILRGAETVVEKEVISNLGLDSEHNPKSNSSGCESSYL